MSMTVEDLISELQQFPGDVAVVVDIEFDGNRESSPLSSVCPGRFLPNIAGNGEFYTCDEVDDIVTGYSGAPDIDGGVYVLALCPRGY